MRSLRLPCVLVVLVLAGLVVPGGALAARTIDCGNFDLVRWTRAPIVGAGIHDLEARGVGCRAARRIARHFGLGSADGHYRGFRCRNTARATELVRARCTRHGQVITWEAGA